MHSKNEFGSYTEFRYRGYVVDFQNNDAVTSIVTTLAREKTPAGVGVGSSWSQVRKKVPNVRCEGVPALGDCHVGALLPGRKVTDFFVQGRQGQPRRRRHRAGLSGCAAKLSVPGAFV